MRQLTTLTSENIFKVAYMLHIYDFHFKKALKAILQNIIMLTAQGWQMKREQVFNLTIIHDKVYGDLVPSS